MRSISSPPAPECRSPRFVEGFSGGDIPVDVGLGQGGKGDLGGLMENALFPLLHDAAAADYPVGFAGQFPQHPPGVGLVFGDAEHLPFGADHNGVAADDHIFRMVLGHEGRLFLGQPPHQPGRDGFLNGGFVKAGGDDLKFRHQIAQKLLPAGERLAKITMLLFPFSFGVEAPVIKAPGEIAVGFCPRA